MSEPPVGVKLTRATVSHAVPITSGRGSARSYGYPVAPLEEIAEWTTPGRETIRRMILFSLGYSIAYHTLRRPSALVQAGAVADCFLDALGPMATFYTASEGYEGALDENGAPPRSGWGRGSIFIVTPATFELFVVGVGHDRAGIFLVTDED